MKEYEIQRRKAQIESSKNNKNKTGEVLEQYIVPSKLPRDVHGLSFLTIESRLPPVSSKVTARAEAEMLEMLELAKLNSKSIRHAYGPNRFANEEDVLLDSDEDMPGRDPSGPPPRTPSEASVLDIIHPPGRRSQGDESSDSSLFGSEDRPLAENVEMQDAPDTPETDSDSDAIEPKQSREELGCGRPILQTIFDQATEAVGTARVLIWDAEAAEDDEGYDIWPDLPSNFEYLESSFKLWVDRRLCSYEYL